MLLQRRFSSPGSTTTATGTKTTSNMSSSSIKSNKEKQISANPSVPAAATPNSDDNNNQLGVPQIEATKSRKIHQSSNNCRKTRQLRMFKVIIVIMTTFFICRLPTWIFLLIKMNKDLSLSPSWIVHFSLGLLSLTNCAINPFLYTFLTETIRFGSDLKARARMFCCWCSYRGEGTATVTNVEVDKCTPKAVNLHRSSLWRTVCCWCEPCVKEELPDDKNLIDHCESKNKYFRRKSYTLNGKDQLSCISGNVNSPFGHYANVYLNSSPLPVIPYSDPDYFVDVDLMNKK